jgi:hypothetical protein
VRGRKGGRVYLTEAGEDVWEGCEEDDLLLDEQRADDGDEDVGAKEGEGKREGDLADGG